VKKLSIKHLLKLRHRSLHSDKLSIGSHLLSLSGDVVAEEERADGVDGFLVPGELSDLLEGVVLSITRGTW
jgi:hypothetical protein